MGAPKGNKNALGNKGGRPPQVYNSRTVPPLVKGMRERGATNHEVAETLGVCDATLRRWRAEHVEFARAINTIPEKMADRIEVSYFDRAVGYTFESEKVVVVKGKVVKVPITEHVPPDTGAAWNMLKSLRPEKYAEKSKVDATFDLKAFVEAGLEHAAKIRAGLASADKPKGED